MPELPEVEQYKKLFDKNALNKQISDVKILNKRMLQDVTEKELKGKLTGKKFVDSIRRGKYFFAEVKDSGWLILHFGMTGELLYLTEDEEEPKYSRLIITFKNKDRLILEDRRTFGFYSFIENINDYINEKKIGPDALDKSFSKKYYLEIATRKTEIIKTFLMDQAVVSGIGNVYSDEICYQTDVHPGSFMNKLTKDKLEDVYDNAKKILKDAIKYKGKKKLPDDYLASNRKEDVECPRCGGTIKLKKLGGRSSYFCDKHQKLYS